MDTVVGQGPHCQSSSLYWKIFDLVHSHMTLKISIAEDKASNTSGSKQIDEKVNKILKILSDSDN